MGKRTPPDPLDPNDPRVRVEAVDQLGQIYRPGDYICLRGYGSLQFGKVVKIQALRNDGSPLTGGSHQKVHFHWIRHHPDPQRSGDWVLAYFKHHSGWDATSLKYTKETILPVISSVRWNDDLIRCDVVNDNNIIDDPSLFQ